ncbi:MAG: dihydrodipicolinate synthase family protein [Planctomycetota bacterium]
MLHGTLAAAVTPLCDGGAALDEGAFAPLVQYYKRSKVDGLLALGTTGEGILLSTAERMRAAELFVKNSRELDITQKLQIAVHCGAQSTVETIALSRHALEIGADAVAVIGPPYFALDEECLYQHFRAAARACVPIPFYAYEFRARAGYSLSVPLILRLRERCANFAGLKVSNSKWEQFEPYLLPEMDIFVGPEALIQRGLRSGAKGVVSGLAAALPELIVAHAHNPTEADSVKIGKIREALSQLPFHAALKTVLARRGVPIRADVRMPLRGMNPAETQQFEELLKTWKIL